MKILYWTGLFWPNIGGVEVLSMQFIPAMQERGYEFIVVTSKNHPELPDEEYHKGIPIYRFPFYRGLKNNNFEEVRGTREKLIKLKEIVNADLVHLNSIDPSIFFHLLTNGDNVPTLFTVHALPPYLIDNTTLVRKMLVSAQWVTTASNAMLTTVRKIARGIAHRSSIIYYGLNVPRLEITPLLFDEPRLLCLGRIVADKGFDIALDAFAAILDVFPTARLVITGDGPAKSGLEQKAAISGLERAVEFTGWIFPEKVYELINTATAVIIPSRWHEPFGLVALQAAQMARPVIAAGVGGLLEIVEHQKTGLLFDKEDSNGLAQQIAYLLEHPEEATAMGRAAQKKAKELFGFERFIDAYDDLYQNLIT